MTSCGTVPERPEVSQEEQVKIDVYQGRELSHGLERYLKVHKDLEVTVFLRNLAQKLVDATPALSVMPIGVLLIHSPDQLWQSYALPGNKLYLSIGLLKQMKFENEVAAVLAVQLAHLLGRHVLKIQATSSKKILPSEYLKKNGLFAFGLNEHLEACETAVGILYRAGIDARGLVSLWTKYQENPQRSPYSSLELENLMEKTRQTIALNLPLRNPVVRSEAFVKVKKRIDRL